MGFPAIASSATSNNGSSRTTSSSVTLPGSISADDLLVVQISCEADANITVPSGWSDLFGQLNDGNHTMRAFWRQATGAEGASVSVAHQSARTASIALRIAAGNWEGTPQGIGTQGDSTSPNPPNLAPTPAGARQYLWIAMGGNLGNAVSANPTNYAGALSSLGASSDVRSFLATRQLAAASENPDAFTISGAQNWAAATVSILGPYDIAADADLEEGPDTLSADATPDPIWEVINAQLTGATVRVTYLARFDFASGEKRYWQGFGDLPIDAEVWEGTAGLGQISEVTSGPGLAVEEMTFDLAATAEALENFESDAEEAAGRPVSVYLQFFDLRQRDDDGNWVEWNPLGTPLQIFWGRMGPLRAVRPVSDDNPESARAKRSLITTASSALQNRSRPAYGNFSERDQKARVAAYAAAHSITYVPDNIFARVSDVVINKVRWPVF